MSKWGIRPGEETLAFEPRFCDWPKRARCKAREVKVYAHTPNLPQQSRLPVFANPEGFENWLLFSSDVAFTFRCKRWATALHFNLFVRSSIQIPANSQTQNLGWKSAEVTLQAENVRWGKDFHAEETGARLDAAAIRNLAVLSCIPFRRSD